MSLRYQTDLGYMLPLTIKYWLCICMYVHMHFLCKSFHLHMHFPLPYSLLLPEWLGISSLWYFLLPHIWWWLTHSAHTLSLDACQDCALRVELSVISWLEYSQGLVVVSPYILTETLSPGHCACVSLVAVLTGICTLQLQCSHTCTHTWLYPKDHILSFGTGGTKNRSHSWLMGF